MLQDLAHLQKFSVLIDILIFILGSGEKMALRKYSAKRWKGVQGHFKHYWKCCPNPQTKTHSAIFLYVKLKSAIQIAFFFKKKKSNFPVDRLMW